MNEWMLRCGTRRCWSAIFSGALRVKRALFALYRRIARSRIQGGFTSKMPGGRQPEARPEFPGRGRMPMSEYLPVPLENLITAIQRETGRALAGRDLSDVLAAYQGMSDRRRLGIKNEAEGYGLIPLTQGKFAIVDAEDYDRLNQYQWYACKCKSTFYACRCEGGKTIRMHREIMRAPKELICDHINHNGLNNRKSNLRLCTHAQNCYNQQASSTGTSKYKGVSWHKCSGKWSARVRRDRKFYNLGDFENEIEAAMAYDKKAKELFGEFAYPNFSEKRELKKLI